MPAARTVTDVEPGSGAETGDEPGGEVIDEVTGEAGDEVADELGDDEADELGDDEAAVEDADKLGDEVAEKIAEPGTAEPGKAATAEPTGSAGGTNGRPVGSSWCTNTSSTPTPARPARSRSRQARRCGSDGVRAAHPSSAPHTTSAGGPGHDPVVGPVAASSRRPSLVHSCSR